MVQHYPEWLVADQYNTTLCEWQIAIINNGVDIYTFVNQYVPSEELVSLSQFTRYGCYLVEVYLPNDLHT